MALRRDLDVEDDWPWRHDTLSCGQQKRLQVACALWQRPDLLVMDEPSNHVDVRTREAVTAALARFKGVGLLIKKGEIVRKVPEGELVEALREELLHWQR